MIDRLIIHKFDIMTPAPGGIDTCIRGILKYGQFPNGVSILGVDGMAPGSGRRIGEWESYEVGGNQIKFMPLLNMDPGNQRRRVPHALSITTHLLPKLRSLGPVRILQTHRADLSLVSSLTIRHQRKAYFIHTQENGILGHDSDSFWKYGAAAHRIIEKREVKSADDVFVFNPEYADRVRQWNDRALSLPTWWDPEMIREPSPASRRHAVIWVGRMEQPKDPALAVRAFARLISNSEDPWHLTIVGTGNLEEDVRHLVGELGLETRVTMTGRVAGERVAELMSQHRVLLMTSVPGYEGFPRVLVEGLASGLSAVVTDGVDTGQLVRSGKNGLICGRDPEMIATAIKAASVWSPAASRDSVAHLSAPSVVSAIFPASAFEENIQ